MPLAGIEGAVVGRLVHLDLGDGEVALGKTIEEPAGEVFGRGSERQHGEREAFAFEGGDGCGRKRALLHKKGVVKLVGDFGDDAFEHAKVNDHVAHGAVVRDGAVISQGAFAGRAILQILNLDGRYDTPAVAVEVLALAVIVGKEVGAVEVRLGLKTVHASPFAAWGLGHSGVLAVILRVALRRVRQVVRSSGEGLLPVNGTKGIIVDSKEVAHVDVKDV